MHIIYLSIKLFIIIVNLYYPFDMLNDKVIG